MTDDKFLEKASKFFIMQDTSGKFYTMDEYKVATETQQKNKEGCLLYTSDAADDLLCVDLGGSRIIKKKKT